VARFHAGRDAGRRVLPPPAPRPGTGDGSAHPLPRAAYVLA
jgi:hypothetical protein